MPVSKKLVIVESPTKMKSIAQYLGDEYEVLSSVGHIRDLIEPKNLPPELKKGSLGKFSVDVENGFEPYYVVSDNKRKTVAELKKALKNASELLLATDEDREGEAIAWHLLQELNPKVPARRMVFHEITKEAIQRAKDNTRALDTALVDAQETRRILDRLYGYEVSPVLWRKVGPGLSAGRVQSAATRLVVDRERERMAFVAAPYWDLIGTFTGTDATTKNTQSFEAKIVRLAGDRIATGRDFDDRGNLKGNAVVLDGPTAEALRVALTASSVNAKVAKVESKPYSRRPAAPFTTSTLQQESGRKLRLSARDTMRVAQSLYENGYITYMRTDSVSLSDQAVKAARAQATKLYGADSIPDTPRVYVGKSKNAQEAHEAIRPSGEVFRTPAELASSLRGSELALYDLIWKRTVASQMADAKGSTATVTLNVGPTAADAVVPDSPSAPLRNTIAEFTASGTVITFRGFLAAYEESRDDERGNDKSDDADVESKLPALTEGQAVNISVLEAKSHETTALPRYTEASLVKRLEELGIGRPSTFASIISTILDRGYVTLRGQALVPSWVAFAVVKLLEEHFADLVEYDFTAEMENDLDLIASGKTQRVDWLKGFYFGSATHPGLRNVVDNLGDIDARAINSIPISDGVTLRIGRYGPYLEVFETGAGQDATPRRVTIPDGVAPDEMTPARARELIDTPVQGDRVLGENPATGKIVVAKDGRYGPYVTEVDPSPTDGSDMVVDLDTGEVKEADSNSAAESNETKKPKRAKKVAVEKPRTASLFKTMTPETVDLATALMLLDLPRVVGVDPESSEEITAQNGRYGPYLKRGIDTRTLPTEQAILDIDLAGALELYAQPKYGARAASSALKEFEADPVSGKPIKVKDGRFGPYVTDGTTNATIPRGESVEEIDFARAVELLQIKRDKGPVAPRGRKSAAKKSPAKKTAAKKTPAKKTPAKKTPAKKTPAKKTATKATVKNAVTKPTPSEAGSTASAMSEA